MKRKEHFEAALEYTRKHIAMDEVKSAQDAMLFSENMSEDYYDEVLWNAAYDCMEEYSDEHNLPEGWWQNFGDTTDIIKML